MIAIALAFLRNSLGIGKTEIGVLLHLIVVIIYLLPVLPVLDWGMMMNVHTVIGAFTLSGLVGRIEKMKTVLKALQSIFLQWGKKW